MDEYVGLGDGDEKTFAHYLNAALFDRVRMKAVYYIGSAGDVGTLCERYEKLLKEHPIDIECLGIGENGHIAFNDPHVADFRDKKAIKLVDLDEKCRRQQVNDKTFDTLDEVPKYAVTLTVPTLVSANTCSAWCPRRTRRTRCSTPCTTRSAKRCPPPFCAAIRTR